MYFTDWVHLEKHSGLVGSTVVSQDEGPKDQIPVGIRIFHCGRSFTVQKHTFGTIVRVHSKYPVMFLGCIPPSFSQCMLEISSSRPQQHH